MAIRVSLLSLRHVNSAPKTTSGPSKCERLGTNHAEFDPLNHIKRELSEIEVILRRDLPDRRGKKGSMEKRKGSMEKRRKYGMSTRKKKVIRKTAPILGAAAAAVGIALVPGVADAAPIQKAKYVLAGYQNVIYRGDWYNDRYYYGGPAPTRGFWGKGSSGHQYRNGNANHHRYR
jgi:hypothetical protein